MTKQFGSAGPKPSGRRRAGNRNQTDTMACLNSWRTLAHHRTLVGRPVCKVAERMVCWPKQKPSPKQRSIKD